MTEPAIATWSDVEALLAAAAPGAVMRVPRGWLPHPRAEGLRPAVGLPLGQEADFVRPSAGARLHVERHRRHDLVWLEASPSTVPAAAVTPPASRARRAAAVGALAGAFLTRSPAGALAAALLAGLTVAVSTPAPRPRSRRRRPHPPAVEPV